MKICFYHTIHIVVVVEKMGDESLFDEILFRMRFKKTFVSKAIIRLVLLKVGEEVHSGLSICVWQMDYRLRLMNIKWAFYT